MLGIILLAIAMGVSAVAAGALRVFSARSVCGPPRLPGQRSAGEVALVLVGGFFIWMSIQSAFVAWKQTQFAKVHGAAAPMTESSFTPGDWAFLSNVPPLGAFLVLLAGDFFVGGPALVRGLGLSIRRLFPGIRAGLVGSIIVLPFVFCVVGFIAWLYDHLHYQTPKEHELLTMMHQAQSTFVRVLLILAAVVVAPVFEEFLFRAHLQTLIRAVLIYLSRRNWTVVVPKPSVNESIQLPASANTAGAIPKEVSAGHAATPTELSFVEALPVPPAILSYAERGSELELARSDGVWQSWMSIVLASIIFASVHPLWMSPPIFCLAVGLGYVYERTGNLWASITMHCVFNSVSTAMYLNGMN